MRTISPFALKLETWLRLADIKWDFSSLMKIFVKLICHLHCKHLPTSSEISHPSHPSLRDTFQPIQSHLLPTVQDPSKMVFLLPCPSHVLPPPQAASTLSFYTRLFNWNSWILFHFFMFAGTKMCSQWKWAAKAKFPTLSWMERRFPTQIW